MINKCSIALGMCCNGIETVASRLVVALVYSGADPLPSNSVRGLYKVAVKLTNLIFFINEWAE